MCKSDYDFYLYLYTVHMLPQYCAIFTDCIYKNVTLGRLNIDSLMMVCTDRNK